MDMLLHLGCTQVGLVFPPLTWLALPVVGNKDLPGGLASSSSADEVRSRMTSLSVTWQGGCIHPDGPDTPILGASFFFVDVQQGAMTFSAKVNVQQGSMGNKNQTHSRPQHGCTASGPVCTACMTYHPAQSSAAEVWFSSVWTPIFPNLNLNQVRTSSYIS